MTESAPMVTPLLPQRRAVRATLPGLIITLVIITVLILAVSLTSSRDDPALSTAEGLGFLFGTGLGGALIFGGGGFLVLYFASLRSSGRRVGVPYFTTLFVWSGLFAVLAHVMFAGAASGGGHAAMVAEMQGYLQRATAQEAASRAQLAANDPEHLLDPAFLHSTADIPGQRARVQRLRQLALAGRANMVRLQDEEHARLAAAFPGELASFDRGVQGSRARMDQMIDASRANMDEIAATLDFLEQSSRHWRSQNGHYVFDDQPTLDAFNGHMIHLQATLNAVRQLLSENQSATDNARNVLTQEGGAAPP
jgi:hypothetical protein